MFDRIKHIVTGFKARLETDPLYKSKVLFLSGTLAIIEGAFGVVRNGATAKGRGIFGSITTILAGFALLWISNLVDPTAYDAVKTEGTVNSYVTVTNENKLMYAPVYTYVVNDTKYNVQSQSLFGMQPRIGETVTIEYSKSQPEYAYRVDGIDGVFNNGFYYVALIIIASGIISFTFNCTLIAVGVYFIILSRRARPPEDKGSIFQSFLNAKKEILSGDVKN
jgi:hypothetical protein